MPQILSHQFFAEDLLLSEKIKNLITKKSHYFLGAQGGDILFLYSPKTSRKSNLGLSLHNLKIEEVTHLIKEKKEKGEDVSYLVGFLSHLILDESIHPYVYALEKILKEENREKDNYHYLIGSDLDLYFLEKLKGKKKRDYSYPNYLGYLNYKKLKNDLNSLLTLVNGEFKVKEKRLEIVIKLYFFINNKITYDQKRLRRSIYFVEEKLNLSHRLSYLIKRGKYNLSFEEKNKKYYDFAPLDLFALAKDTTLKLLEEV